jgi:secondary thiamine-phosphate synthase enzyme
MKWFKEAIQVETSGKGMYSITDQINRALVAWDIREGMCFLFIPHTSASLLINESYDPSAREDMENFLEHLAPEGEAWYRHTMEGSDDSPSHLRAMLTQSSLSIPVDGGVLSLGTWQGIYLFEHRTGAHRRKVLIRYLEAA